MKDLFLLSWSLVLFAAAARADTIVLANGTRYNDVEVVTARWDSVQFKLKTGGAQTVTGDDVDTLDRVSVALEPARRSLQAGNFKQAATELEGVPNTAKDWEKAEAGYLLGEALLGAGDAKKAEDAFKAYIDKQRAAKDWWVPAAAYKLGESLLARKQPGTAETHFKELQQFGKKWELRAKLGQGKAMLDAKGKAAALPARTLFNDVIRDSKPPLKEEAMAERARSYIIAEQYDQAVKDLEANFFNAPKSGELAYSAERGLATLLMGQAYLGLGGKENLERAELWLLKYAALHGRQQSATFGRACDLLVDVYGKLGRQDRAEEWKKRKPANGGGK